MSIILLFKSKQNVLYCRRLLFVFLLLVTSKAFYSQSLSKENTSLYLGEGATIFIKEKESVSELKGKPLALKVDAEKGTLYVSKNTHIYGFNHLENFKISETKTTQNKITHALNKQKTKRSTYRYDTSDRKTKTTAFVKTQEKKHFFGLLTGTAENAVLNNTSTYKHHLIHHNNAYTHPSFEDHVRVLFSIYSFSPTRGKTNCFYTRPPPFL